jgi:F-box protein 9
MDDRVDLKYKSKHFPPSNLASTHTTANPSNAPITVSNTAQHTIDPPSLPIKELIAGFSSLKIEPAPAEIEGTPQPLCPISSLPDEILTHILVEVAISDLASWVRLAQVCKRLAYLVATEESVWKRVCLGSEVGFGAMHYSWQKEIMGGPLVLDETYSDEIDTEDGVTNVPDPALNTQYLLNSVYASSWLQMFRLRPRIRFNGCYISTVNYIRPGQASPTQITWNSPVHIVTYYRYLRFFRDGTVISLLTTSEPSDVVHYLTKDLQDTHKSGGGAHLPSIVMQTALRGRWRLSNAADNPGAELKDSEGDVFVETEGVGPRYVYRMELTLKSAGKGARNNKMAWKGFWSYNRLTDDWAEFTLRNDKAFFWSRVKSYGNGA